MHFVYTLYGGVANVAAGIINYQHTLGYKTILAYVCYDSAIESQVNHECEKIHVRMPKIPGASMLFGMKVLKIYKNYVKKHPEEVVIVHVHNVQTLGYYANWRKIPIICTLHGFNCPQKSIRKYFSDYLYKETILKLLNYNKKVTAVSRAIVEANELKRIRSKDKIRVIHNFAQVDMKDKREHSTFNIGHVGDLSFEKGWDTLWKAYTLLSENDRNNIFLYAAGKEADFSLEWIRREAEKIRGLQNVIYEGYVANAKKDFISKLDILVLASRNEGLGLVQIEAMGYGIPVLGRNTGGICEVLQDAYNGFVIKDEFDLRDKIVKMHDDRELYMRLSHNAKKTYIENFTMETIMKKYKAVYDELLETY